LGKVNRPKLDLTRQLRRKRKIRFLKLSLGGIGGLLLGSLLFHLCVRLPLNQGQPIDAIFVLGGSIQREIHAAQLATQWTDIPILISSGSPVPCVQAIFQKAVIAPQRVWLERCAKSTFENFLFSIPLLKNWQVHRVKMITSVSHLPRAQWLAQILLGSQGIVVEIEALQERGRPGNQESMVKTIVDMSRSFIWAILGQGINLPCQEIFRLDQIDPLAHSTLNQPHCERIF